jgi:class 3 adenylate cyclase/CheY-like chemotaxis protein
MTASERSPDQTVLAVDDTPDNLSLLTGLLKESYRVKVANSGEKALKIAFSDDPPDLILLDIMMPEMDGYEVCRQLKGNPVARDIPVIFLTAKSEVEDERMGLELGAVDYLTKPVSPPLMLARVKNHLALRHQAKELEHWNHTLERRVAAQLEEMERLERLRRFFSPAVADLLLGSDPESHLIPRRREIVVVFLDLRGYTAFTEKHGPEEVMRVLGEFHSAMGELIMAYGGTLERFAGDGLMIFFNDPIEIESPAQTAMRMAHDMQQRFKVLQTVWVPRGYTLEMGIGIAQGIAIIGAIGFEGRRDYGAIGPVTNLAARLCAEAKGGMTLVSALAATSAGELATRRVGELTLKGFSAPVAAYELIN